MKSELKIVQRIKFKGDARTLFFISTALQLLNAIEAQKHFKTKNNILVLLYFGNQNKDHAQLEKLIELFDYSKLIIFRVGIQKKYLNLIISLLRELQKDNYIKVFSGFFSANLRRFIANVKYQELFLIDDGVYTISLHHELNSKNIKGYKKYITEYSEKPRNKILARCSFYLYRQFRKYYLRIHGFQNDMKEMSLKFYTIFNLPQYNNEIIVKNNYDFLRSHFLDKNMKKNKRDTNIVYFLGQPLGRAFGLEDNEYISYLESIFSLYSTNHQKIIYIPHRAEKKDMIKRIESLDENILIKEIVLPFELYILKKNINVTHIASFLSSALFTMKKIYPNIQVDAFELKIEGEIGMNNSLIYNILRKDNANIILL